MPGRASSSDNQPELHRKWDQQEQEGRSHTKFYTRLRVTSKSQEEGQDASVSKLS